MGRAKKDGPRSDWTGLALTVQTPTGATVTPVDNDGVPAILATRFALPGYELNADGRLVATAKR